MKKETIKRWKENKISTAIIAIGMTVFMISLILALFWRLEMMLCAMIFGGITGYVMDYQHKKELKRPLTEEEEEELQQLIRSLGTSNDRVE